MSFVVATFDNSQMMTKQKFQRGGKSSNITLVTSQMFLQPIDTPATPVQYLPPKRAKMTYLDQTNKLNLGLHNLDDIYSTYFETNIDSLETEKT